MRTYRHGFPRLSPKAQFHFASRLYLWQQDPQAASWLQQLRPNFTASEQPHLALKRLLAEPLPMLRQTAALREPYFKRYPQLRGYERALFHLLFTHSLYGIDARGVLCDFFDIAALIQQRDALLKDQEALTRLSSFGVNFLYLFERFMSQAEDSLPLDELLRVGQTGFDSTKPLERQLQCYFYTHCIIGESLFYTRSIPTSYRAIYAQMLNQVEKVIDTHFDTIKLDVKYEFLVCCRLLGYASRLTPKILRASAAALCDDGYLVEPLPQTYQIVSSLSNAEHRNVLFLLSQRPFQPLLRNVMLA